MALSRVCPLAKYKRILPIIRAFQKGIAVSLEILNGFALKGFGLWLWISDLGPPSKAYGDKQNWA